MGAVPHGGPKRAPDPPGTGVTYGCELPCGCWQSNSGSLKSSQCSNPSHFFSSNYDVIMITMCLKVQECVARQLSETLSLLPLWDLGSRSGCQVCTASALYPLSDLTCPWQLFDLMFYCISTIALRDRHRLS